MIDPNLVVNCVKCRGWGGFGAAWKPLSLVMGSRLLKERCVCLQMGLKSPLGWISLQGWIWSSLVLRDYLFSFHHYTTDFELLLHLGGFRRQPPINWCALKNLIRLPWEKWNWEEMGPFWPPHGVEEWDWADDFGPRGAECCCKLGPEE